MVGVGVSQQSNNAGGGSQKLADLREILGGLATLTAGLPADVAVPFAQQVQREFSAIECLKIAEMKGAEEEMAHAARLVKGQIGFYGSTPAYKEVLDHHGWGDAHGELNAMTKSNRWAELGDVIDDDMLATFAVVAEPDEVEAALEARYGATVDRISRYAIG